MGWARDLRQRRPGDRCRAIPDTRNCGDGAAVAGTACADPEPNPMADPLKIAAIANDNFGFEFIVSFPTLFRIEN